MKYHVQHVDSRHTASQPCIHTPLDNKLTQQDAHHRDIAQT